MKLILSPAKRMQIDDDSPVPPSRPLFLDDACRLWAVLLALTPAQRQALWRCSDAIAQENEERLVKEYPARAVTPALYAFSGLAYRYLAPAALTDAALDWLESRLFLLSGLYGTLRPFDGVVPYRLEMGARLAVGEARNLYEFWGDRVARQVFAGGQPVLNLASEEYARCVTRHVPSGVRLVTCVFGELRGGRVVEKGTLCKMARGEMVRWLAERGAERIEEARDFDHLDYAFSPEHSTETQYVFLKAPRKERAWGKGF